MSPTQEQRHDSTRNSTASENDAIIQFFDRLEDRLKAIESRLEAIDGLSLTTKKPPVSASHSQRLARSTSDSKPRIKVYNNETFAWRNVDHKEVYAIELLVNKWTLSKIHIRSKQVLELLQGIMGSTLVPDVSNSLMLDRPFEPLFIFADQLLDVKRSLRSNTNKSLVLKEVEESTVAAADIVSEGSVAVDLEPFWKLLDELFTGHLEAEHATYLALRSRKERTISFKDLWCLFQPGDEVVKDDGRHSQAYMISNVVTGVARTSDSNQEEAGESANYQQYLVIDCFSIGFDGTDFGPVQVSFTVEHFTGSRQITLLPIVPIEYFDTGIRGRLIHRGQNLMAFRRPRLVDHHGGSQLQTHAVASIPGHLVKACC